MNGEHMADTQETESMRLVLLGFDAQLDRIRPVLEAPDIRVDAATDPNDVKERIATEPIDCVVCRYALSGTDGIAFADWLGEQNPTISVVLVAEDGSESLAARAVSANVASYLTLDEVVADPEELLEVVRTNLETSACCQATVTEYRTLVEHFPNGLVTHFDQDLRYTVVGGTGFADLDIDSDDLVGKRPRDVFPSENAEPIEELYERALNGEESVRELELEGRIFRVQILPVTDNDGSIVGGMTVSQDVTERRERERRLRRYETVVETIDDGISWIDTDQRFTFVNRSVADLFDISRDTVVGSRVKEILDNVEGLSTATIQRIERAIDNVLTGTVDEARIEITVDRPDGPLYRDLKFVPINVDGEIIGAVGVNRDITERTIQEEKLRESERKYRGLVEAAPDAIFLADAESGRILEANDAAGDLLGRPPDEIAGMHQSALHPTEDAEAYKEQFQRHVEHGGTFRRLPDGRQMVVTDADGRRTPVAVSARSLDVGGRKIIHGIFRDISDQIWFEAALTSLHEVARALAHTDQEHEVFKRITVAAEDLSDLSIAIGYRFDVHEGRLVPAAWSPMRNTVIEEPPEIGPGENPFWRALHGDETVVLTADEGTFDAPDPFAAAVAVPLAGYGILVVGDHEATDIDPAATEIFEILATDAIKALGRTERERHLAKRDRELERKDQQIERLSDATGGLQEAVRIGQAADTPEAVEQAACEMLAGRNRIVGAWTTRTDGQGDDLVPSGSAGDIESYRNAVDLSLDEDCLEPTAITSRTGESVVVSNTSRDLREESWRRRALESGLRSVISTPIEADGVQYGTLTVYAPEPGTFTGELRQVVRSTAAIIALGIRALHRRDALVNTRVTELEFRVRQSRSPLVQLAHRLGGQLTISKVSTNPSNGETITVVIESPINGISEEALEALEGIKRVTGIDRDNNRVGLDVTIDDDSLPTILANAGLTLRRLSIEDDECRVAIGVPPTMALSRATAVVDRWCPGADVLAKREDVDRIGAILGSHKDSILSALTDRQREAMDLAIRRGYFETPKDVTGRDLADAMGISATAFHEHLRTAERKLLTRLIGDESDPDAAGPETATGIVEQHREDGL